ncbi:MAG: cation:proton antiporter, partial [Mucilaginibacter polytrichastri]|nr:cation:proton antiporter [Mucilaginibacter polytrichastri]
GSQWISHWFWYDVLYRVAIALLIGYVLGRIISYLFFYLAEKKNIANDVQEGFVALSSTLVVYGFTELLHGYGFMAVFVAAVTLRHRARDHEYFTKLHRFTDQIERMLLAVVLILLGGTVVSGVLDPLDWKMCLAGLAFVLFVRPLSGWLGILGTRLRGHKLSRMHRFAISFFGIKGVGSIFYLTFALHTASFPNPDQLWAIVIFVVLVSIIIHGLTANRIISRTSTEMDLEEMIR